MANSVKGEVALQFEGQTYRMVLDMNALCEFEDATGKPALSFLERMDAKDVSALDLRALMWAGLKQFHPDITIIEAGRILSANVNAIADAVAVGFGLDAGAQDAGNRPAARKVRRA